MEPVATDLLVNRGGAARLVVVLAVIGTMLATAIFLRRGAAVYEAARVAPGVAVSSGCEDESIFAIWRAAHGEPVYRDVAQLPYASAYFNWLFYASYAVTAKLSIRLHGDTALIQSGRWLTEAGAAGGVLGLTWLLRTVMAGQGWLAASIATLVFFGPLVGWWAHTMRPDVWAMVLETGALAHLLLLHRHRPLTAAAGALLLFYAAWAFKPSYLIGLAAAAVFLLARQQWRPLALLLMGTVVLWVVTIQLMGPDYRATLLGTATSNVFYLSHGWQNLIELLAKSAPLWLLAAPAMFWRPNQSKRSAPSLPADARFLGLIGLGIALPLSFAAGCKLGASSNYFFTTLTMLSLLVPSAAVHTASLRWLASGLAAAVALHSAVLLGYAGQTDLTAQTRELSDIWRTWANQPEPRFSHLTSLNLPWISPNSPPLVMAYNYGLDRASGRPFEHDGLGGLIAAGHFQTLLLPADTGVSYDGASLGGYVRGSTVSNLVLFHQKPAPSP